MPKEEPTLDPKFLIHLQDSTRVDRIIKQTVDVTLSGSVVNKNITKAQLIQVIPEHRQRNEMNFASLNKGISSKS